MLQRKACAVLVVILALAVGPACAQQAQHDQHHPDAAAPPAVPGGPSMMPGASAGGMPMMDMMRMMMGQDGMGGMRMMAAMAGHVEGRLAFLKTELKITDAQLPLWNAFAQAARENAKAMEEMMQGGMMGMSQSGTLPERLALREKMMAAHLEALRKLKTSVDPLYAALSDEQKKTADTLVLSPMGMMM
jgi:LTXXQ motif family protein